MTETCDSFKPYPLKLLRLLNITGFNEAFEERLSKARTQAEAYELTEQERERWFGGRAYSDWESFRQFRYRFLKKRKICK